MARRRGLTGVPAKGVIGFFKRFLPGLKKSKVPSAKPTTPASTPTPPRTRPDYAPSPLARDHPLPTPRNLERGPNGLVTKVDGKPVKDYLDEVSRQRTAKYRELQLTDPTNFSRGKSGPVSTVLMDRRTGELFEGNNKMLGREIPDNLHPTLQRQVDSMTEAAKANPTAFNHGAMPDGTQIQDGYPHPDKAGTHSEVAAANQALWAREARGLPADDVALGEMSIDNRFIFGASTQDRSVPCCANCTAILGDIESFSGKLTTFTPKSA